MRKKFGPGKNLLLWKEYDFMFTSSNQKSRAQFAFGLQALVKFAVICYMITNVNQMKSPLWPAV